MTTTTPVTDRQIVALQTEAAAAGDLAQVAICELALNGWSDDVDMSELASTRVRNQDSARVECARVIRAAQAMAD